MSVRRLSTMPVHIVDIPDSSTSIALLSDLHLDNPHCIQSILEQHLQYCLENNIKVILNGDTFCAMEGKGDRRGSKNLRSYMVSGNYLNKLVEYHAEFFAPYIDILELFTYGNHETSVLNHKEFDLLKGLQDSLYIKTGKKINLGGYTGWVIFKVKRTNDPSKFATFKLKYHHGFGGGAPVTKGVIDFSRIMTVVQNADAIWMGHKHTDTHIKHKVESISERNVPYYKTIDLIRTPTYKDEHSSGFGWAIEKGIPPSEIGGRLLTLEYARERKVIDKKEVSNTYVFSKVTTFESNVFDYHNTILRMQHLE